MDDTQHLGNLEAGFDSVILGQQGTGQWMPLGFTSFVELCVFVRLTHVP